MSIRHAANRFLRTSIDGWDGSAWVLDVTKGSLQTNDRFISDREFPVKVRNLLVSPDNPIPPQYKVVRVGGADQIYLVGASTTDTIGTAYSTVVTLRKANYTGEVKGFVSQTAASGMKIAPVKTTLGTYFCDRQVVTFAASKDIPGVKYGDELVILPAGTVVETTHEITIDDSAYEVEQVYDYAGLRYCRCIVRRNSEVP